MFDFLKLMYRVYSKALLINGYFYQDAPYALLVKLGRSLIFSAYLFNNDKVSLFSKLSVF
jgi:hypothetical protein